MPNEKSQGPTALALCFHTYTGVTGRFFAGQSSFFDS